MFGELCEEEFEFVVFYQGESLGDVDDLDFDVFVDDAFGSFGFCTFWAGVISTRFPQMKDIILRSTVGTVSQAGNAITKRIVVALRTLSGRTESLCDICMQMKVVIRSAFFTVVFGCLSAFSAS